MLPMGVGTLLAVLFGLGAAVVAARQTLMARSHRKVGAFAFGVVVTVGLLLATVSFVVLPDLWLDGYRAVMGGYDSS
jgi:drug/metabolite transporter (DMT)-like permease